MHTILTLVLAQPAAEPTTDPFGWALGLFKWIAEQFAAKNYGAAVAGIIMIAVFILKLVLKEKLSSGALPMVAAAAGLALSLATSLSGLKTDMDAAAILGIIMAGLTTGAMASGFWSLLGKHLVDWLKGLFAKKAPAVEPAALTPAAEPVAPAAPAEPAPAPAAEPATPSELK